VLLFPSFPSPLVLSHCFHSVSLFIIFILSQLLLLLLLLLQQLSFHPVAVVLTLIQTKHMRIKWTKMKQYKTQYKQHKTLESSTHITKTQLSKHPHITKQVKTTIVWVGFCIWKYKFGAVGKSWVM
jgi:hypothetical protein